MNKKLLILFMVLLISISGCIEPYQTADQADPFQQEPVMTAQVTPQAAGTGVMTPVPVITIKSEMLINRISENLTWFNDRKWNTLYKTDELDCSRMSAYFWDYIRRNFKVAPKIIISYERQHAWLALKVSEVGNSSDYSRWNIKGTDYYFVEATIPRVVAEDNQSFLINGQEFTSAEFYNAAIYVLETPQDANDFHAQNSALGGWNQEFRLKKDDLDKISKLLGS